MLRQVQLAAMSLVCLIVSGCCCCGPGHPGAGAHVAHVFNSPVFGSSNGDCGSCGAEPACGPYSSCGSPGQCGESACEVISDGGPCGCRSAWSHRTPAAPVHSACGEGCRDCMQHACQHQSAFGVVPPTPAETSEPVLQEPQIPLPVPAETPQNYDDASTFGVRDVRRTSWAATDTRVRLPGKRVSRRELHSANTPMHPMNAPPMLTIPPAGI